jgi:hypothetical protein
MIDSGLRYFTHEVDGALYGAWYRIVSPTQLEVIGVGLLQACEFAGFSPECSAKSILENFVRVSRSMGVHVPFVRKLEREESHDDPAARRGSRSSN